MIGHYRRMRAALAEIAAQHEPYLPIILDVVTGVPWEAPVHVREATLEEKAAALEWWCDGCRLPAANCLARPILDRLARRHPPVEPAPAAVSRDA